MSLRPCEACKQQISSDAKVCPHCGKKVEMSIGRGCLVVILALIIGGAIINGLHRPGNDRKGSKDSGIPLPVKPYVLPDVVSLEANAHRTDDGGIVILGNTNFPDGMKMWVHVESGRQPLGAPRTVASDENVIVRGGKFTSAPLWLEVPNNRFTRKGWPKNVKVDVRQKPFPAGEFKVRFSAYFNGAWQSQDVLAALGGEGGKRLNGKILKAKDLDIVDSQKFLDDLQTLNFPPVSPEANAISLVRGAILNVQGKGRSAGDIQANVDCFMSWGLRPAKGWAARKTGTKTFEVSFDFVNGDAGEEQAIWTANLATGEVRYVNESAKTLSWTPNY